MPSKVKVLLNFSKTHLEIARDAIAVYEGLNESEIFSNPPIPMKQFKPVIDAYTSATSNAVDGGRKAIIERNGLKETLVRMMRQLGHWVEANCQQDLATLRSSGFQAAATVRVAQGPLPQPTIRRIESGEVSGQVFVYPTPIRRARSYELRYATVDSEGKPGAWTLLPPFTSSRKMSVTGLSAGTLYAFQVRAFGKSYTDWSDSANRMSL